MSKPETQQSIDRAFLENLEEKFKILLKETSTFGVSIAREGIEIIKTYFERSGGDKKSLGQEKRIINILIDNGFFDGMDVDYDHMAHCLTRDLEE